MVKMRREERCLFACIAFCSGTYCSGTFWRSPVDPSSRCLRCVRPVAKPVPSCAVPNAKQFSIAPRHARRGTGKCISASVRRILRFGHSFVWKWPANAPWQRSRISKLQRKLFVTFVSKEKEKRRRRSSCGGVRAAGIALVSFTSSA